MTPTSEESLLSLETDTIFESKSVEQISELLRNLQKESDLKREELRSLVGERYRDLMEAAETIISMRQTCSEVSQNIQSTKESISDLSEKLNSFRQAEILTGNLEIFSKDDVNFYALAAQIKLLMDVPERIWSAIEQDQLSKATKLYLFARHIHTNLSFVQEENLAVSFYFISHSFLAQ